MWGRMSLKVNKTMKKYVNYNLKEQTKTINKGEANPCFQELEEWEAEV